MKQDDCESAWLSGNRAAWLRMLGVCLEQLGYDDPEAKKVSWIKEREEAIRELRTLCEEFGDNDWLPSLYLADIIEKHLGKHLAG